MLYHHCSLTLVLSTSLGVVQVNQDGLKLFGSHQVLVFVRKHTFYKEKYRSFNTC